MFEGKFFFFLLLPQNLRPQSDARDKTVLPFNRMENLILIFLRYNFTIGLYNVLQFYLSEVIIGYTGITPETQPSTVPGNITTTVPYREYSMDLYYYFFLLFHFRRARKRE